MEEYYVIGVDQEDFRVIDDRGEPVLYPKALFDVLDPKLSSGWQPTEGTKGEFNLQPVRTSRPGFYEDYFCSDGDRTAEAETQQVLREVLEAEMLTGSEADRMLIERDLSKIARWRTRARQYTWFVEAGVPGRLAIVPMPRGGGWLDHDLRECIRAGLDLIVSLLTDGEMTELSLCNETECARAVGLDFRRLPVPERSAPTLPERDAETLVVALAEELRAGRSVGIHSRLGIGRSGLLATVLLVELGINAEEAIHLVSTSRGEAIPETMAQKEWIRSYARTRYRPPR
jgi:hypothetical protein